MKACPTGWRLPSNEDFKELLSITGAGDDSSSIRDEYWKNGSNSSGFGALPAGRRWYIGDFDYFGSSARFWSATPDGDDYAYYLYVNSDGADVSYYYRKDAYSVRCLRDSN